MANKYITWDDLLKLFPNWKNLKDLLDLMCNIENILNDRIKILEARIEELEKKR